MHGIMKPDWSRDVIHASNNSSKVYKFVNIVHNYPRWNIYFMNNIFAKKKIKK